MANVVYKNVTKRFDEVVAVDNISLEIKDAEFVVLVGPSGCGKSTTLRMVAGLEDITAGEIYIGDKLVNNLVPKDRNVAMVFQNYALYPHMNVAENMAFGLKMRKVTPEEREKRIRVAAETLGIVDLLKRKPRQLSGGQRQRVALGRAIVRDPAVFLFDEPLSNLDAKLRVQMRTELKKLHERINTTSIYVTHDQVEAMTMGERIVVMKDGLVQQVGPPLELYNHPENQFVASFIGSPAMNFIPCSLTEEKGVLYIEFDGFRLPIPPEKRHKLEEKDDQYLNFGLRPEDLDEYKEGDDPHIILEAMVEVIEPLGKEIQMNITVGNHDLNIILPADNKAKLHQKIKLVPNLDKGHLFLKSNGETIF